MEALIAKRVLVTGGCGFIGRHLVRRLAGAGCDVVVLDDLTTGILDGTRNVADVRLASILDADAVRDAVRGCDLVFHLAGLVGKQLVHRDPGSTYRVSVDGTRNLLDLAPEIPTVIFSSSAVYGVEATGPVTEDAAGDMALALAYDGGTAGYACGKLEMERMARDAAARGRRVLVVRPFNVVGPGQTGQYGMVVPRFVRSALAGEPIVIYDDGTQVRSFGHVNTFVSVLLTLAGKQDAWLARDPVVNIGSPHSTSILNLAGTVKAVTHSRSAIAHVPYETAFPGERDVRERVPDLARLRALTGDIAWPDMEMIVRDVVGDEGARVERDDAPGNAAVESKHRS